MSFFNNIISVDPGPAARMGMSKDHGYHGIYFGLTLGICALEIYAGKGTKGDIVVNRIFTTVTGCAMAMLLALVPPYYWGNEPDLARVLFTEEEMALANGLHLLVSAKKDKTSELGGVRESFSSTASEQYGNAVARVKDATQLLWLPFFRVDPELSKLLEKLAFTGSMVSAWFDRAGVLASKEDLALEFAAGTSAHKELSDIIMKLAPREFVSLFEQVEQVEGVLADETHSLGKDGPFIHPEVESFIAFTRRVVLRMEHFDSRVSDLEERVGGSSVELTFPNARLVRSMRRCDCEFIPLLNKWSVVDVAVTRYEMVYFDAIDVDQDASLDAPGEFSRQAIMATKGGKGLRLCDVATGRRIVGHLHLSEIDSVHVERHLPHERKADAVECPGVEVDKTEFWKKVSGRSHANGIKRGDEWCGIKQDVLRIHTKHGHTLNLRFYSDLEDAENHAERLASENEKTGNLFKNNAFQWAQTIGRVRGSSQLQQKLPHFGDDTSEELRDFLIVNGGTDPMEGHRDPEDADDFGFSSMGQGELDQMVADLAPGHLVIEI